MPRKTARKPKKKANNKVVLGGAAAALVAVGLLAGGGGSKKEAAPTASPAAIVTEYVTVAPVTQIPVTVASATPVPATAAPATQAPRITDAPTAAPTDIPTLKKGSTGQAVKELQQRLIEMNFLAGSADGDYGNKTVQAVKDFQLVNNLKSDGIAGPETIRKLFSHSARWNHTVYMTENGKVFHCDDDCRNYTMTKSLTVVEAYKKGIEPCSICGYGY